MDKTASAAIWEMGKRLSSLSEFSRKTAISGKTQADTLKANRFTWCVDVENKLNKIPSRVGSSGSAHSPPFASCNWTPDRSLGTEPLSVPQVKAAFFKWLSKPWHYSQNRYLPGCVSADVLKYKPHDAATSVKQPANAKHYS